MPKDKLAHKTEVAGRERFLADERILVVVEEGDEGQRTFVQVAEGDAIPESLEGAERVRYSEVFPT